MSITIQSYNFQQIIISPRKIFSHPLYVSFFNKLLSSRLAERTICSLLSIKHDSIEKFIYSSGTFKLLTKQDAYKVSFFKRQIAMEIQLFDDIRNQFPELSNNIPSFVQIKGVLHGMKMPRYHSIDEQYSVERAMKIHDTLKQYGEIRTCNVEEFSEISQGIKIAKILYPECVFEDVIKKMNQERWRVGPVHGDFHLGNILISNDNKSYVIDVDNFKPSSLQALDVFTIFIDFVSKKYSVSWQNAIQMLVKQSLSPEEILIKKHNMNFHRPAYTSNTV